LAINLADRPVSGELTGLSRRVLQPTETIGPDVDVKYLYRGVEMRKTALPLLFLALTALASAQTIESNSLSGSCGGSYNCSAGFSDMSHVYFYYGSDAGVIYVQPGASGQPPALTFSSGSPFYFSPDVTVSPAAQASGTTAYTMTFQNAVVHVNGVLQSYQIKGTVTFTVDRFYYRGWNTKFVVPTSLMYEVQ
jgi:hypothetical protein